MRSRLHAPLALVALLSMVLATLVVPAAASVVVPIPDDDLIVHADVIVLGQVTRIESHQQDTGAISTYVTVAIDEVLKGLLPGSEVTIKELGGRVGDRMAWMFANPPFQVGERALLFLDQRDDGTLRTFHFFQGKFTIVKDPTSGDLVAARGLPRNVTVLPPAAARAGAAAASPAAGRRFDDFTQRIREKAADPRPRASVSPGPAMPFASAAMPPTGAMQAHGEFTLLSNGFDVFRWHEADANQPVTMRIHADGEPLALTSGFDQIRAAMRAWNRVPTTSFRWSEGEMITEPGAGGFQADGLNAIAFRDPLDEIPPPVPSPFGGCSGTLAIAGISDATSAGARTVSGTFFLTALEGDLVVADGWGGCGTYYENFANFAEVMTHELGHVLGLDHSSVNTADAVNLGAGRAGATMRATAAFDGRGAALHTDDRAGVAFIYPGRTLSIFKTGPGTGTITSGTDGIDCGSDCVAGFAVGSTVALTATPAPGSAFVGFQEAGCGPAVVMSVNRVCTAVFVIDPDLAMTAVTAPTAAPPGTTITISNTVRNNGLMAGPFNVGIYLSNSSTITTMGRLLATRRVAGLAYNAQDADATQVTIPADVSPGSYFIGAIADSDDEVAEGALESNNARAATPATVIGRPDLRVTALTAPAAAGTGLTISASATVSNQAPVNISAPPSTLAFYLSTDATLDVDDTRLTATRAIPQLARNAASAGATVLTIPANQSAGTYFLIANADDLDVVDEQNEGADNTRATATQITVRRPDLRVTSVTAPAVAAAGMNVSVTHIVRNAALAPGNAGGSTSRLFLSSDSALGGDVELGTVTVPALAALTQASVVRSVQIPGNTSAGLYWVLARANALDTILEADSPGLANNVLGTAAPITIGPDLVVTAATAAPAATGPGLVVNVTTTVRNQGGAPASPFAIGIYLSRNASFEAADDVLLGTRLVTATLNAAAMSTAVTPVTIPPGTDAGAYFLIVRADDAGAIAEASEGNNLRATAALQVVKADLQVTSVTATPAAVMAGMNVSVTHVVRNVAPAAGGAPPSFSRLFLSSDQALDPLVDPQLGADVPVGPLAGGGQASLVRSLQVPPGTAPGLYWIFARANATGSVQEAAGVPQANNDRATATPIVVGPDLVVSAAAAAPVSTAPGLTVRVSSTVRNAGAQPAGAFDVGIYLSTDAQYQDGVDLLLATRRVTAGLVAGAMSAAITPVVIPANQSAGAHFLIVRADIAGAAPGEVSEAGEGNNERAVPLSVVRADLVVSALTAPATAAPGMNVSVSHTVRNAALAAGGALPTTTRLHLSTDPTLDGADTALLDVPVGTLAGGASATVVRSVQIPAVAPGLFWIIAEANATGTVIEADAANNTRATAMPILVGPDLVATAGTVTPISTAPGRPVNVASTVRNQGGQAAAPFQVDFALSADPVFDPGIDIPLGSRLVTAHLAPLALSTATTPLVIPGNLSAGAYFVLVLVDAADANVEADESNNLRAIPLTLVRADLTVVSVTATPGAVAAGSNVSVTHVVRNAAAAAGVAGPTISRLYLSTDTSLDGGDVALLDVPVGMLNGQGQAALVRSVQIPGVTTPGLYWILAEANATGAVVEADAGNNTRPTAAPIVVGPDLVVSAVTAVPSASAPGRTVNVSHTVRNQGGQAAPSFDVGIYLSTDDVLDGTDVFLAARTLPAGLAKAGISAAMTPVVLPGNLSSATHFLFVKADIDGTPGDVDEADETNNVRMITLPVVRPDLTVLSITAPAAGAAGASVSVTHVVRNLAPAAGVSPATISRLFLSTDDTLDGADVQLGNDVPVTGLSGMTQVSLTRSVQIPPGTPPGLYFVLAQADAPGAVVESQEGNNVISRPMLIGPDVTLTAASTVAGTIPGATINVVYTLRNLGGAPTGPFNVGFVLVPITPAGPDIPMGPTRTGVVLAAGGALASSTPVVVPAGATQGQYRVRVTTDVDGAVTEVTEANNALTTGPINITPPDLSMAGLVVPAIGIAGRALGIPNSVINTATAPGTSPAFQVGLYVSADGDIDPGTDTLLASRTVATLGPSVTSTATTTVTLPATPGSYFIGAIADRAGVVIESDESDNVQAAAITVVPSMVRSRPASASVTTSGCINPVNNATLGLNGTLTISAQTGGGWTGTVSLPSNTATLTGTVDVNGNVSGTFAIVNAGGARGGGTFSGTAGSGPTGGFAATFTGAFNVGEVCTISASLSAS